MCRLWWVQWCGAVRCGADGSERFEGNFGKDRTEDFKTTVYMTKLNLLGLIMGCECAAQQCRRAYAIL